MRAQAALADLTMRHTIDFKFGSFLPPSAVEAMKSQLGDQMPKEIAGPDQGQKELSRPWAAMVMLGGLSKGVITLLDPKATRFATSPIATYRGEDRGRAEAENAGAAAAGAADVRQHEVRREDGAHGKDGEIQGIHGEEILLTVSMEIPNPSGPAMQMRMEMRQWIGGAEDAVAFRALKELEMYGELQKSGLDPVEMMTKSLATISGDGGQAARSHDGS